VRPRALVATALVAALLPAPALAWPAPVLEALARDARRLLPASLSRLMYEREKPMLEELRRFPPEIASLLAADQVRGKLSPATLEVLDARMAAAGELLRDGKVKDGMVAMAGLVRIPADLSDPALASAEAYPPGVIGEYYAYVQGNLHKIPVVLSDPPALQLQRKALPAYWQRLLTSSRTHSPVLRVELFKRGRLVPHQQIDYRNPVFGVASLAYSRAVTAIAATWLAVWREAQGDLTRQPKPREVVARPGAGPRVAEAP
jgi:hypothetical protein